MKRIYYLMGVIAAAALASCHPMSSTYKALDENPTPSSLTYTLQSADYKLVPKSVDSVPAKTLSFSSASQAKADIPSILNSKFFKYGNGSNASVTYKITAYLAQPDSLYSDLIYTLVDKADYLLLPGNTYNDFSISQTIQWLPYKYPNAKVNQQYVLTFNYYNGSSTVKNSTFAFVYVGGSWVQAYLVPPSGYAAFGRGTYNQFTSSDAANLPNYLNGILKVDATVAATARTGATQYVSFQYYASGKAYQRVLQMQYDGSNWNPVNFATQGFIKSSGSWIPDPSVYYTLTGADCQLIANSTIGGSDLASVRASLAKYGDFEVGSGEFTTALINQAIILVLQNDFPNPTANVPYKVTYLAYTGKDTPTVATFIYNGSAWIAQQ